MSHLTAQDRNVNGTPSKVTCCTRHKGDNSGSNRYGMLKAFVQGGYGQACSSSRDICKLYPGTDWYTKDFVDSHPHGFPMPQPKK